MTPGSIDVLLADLVRQCDQGKPALVSQRVADMSAHDARQLAIRAVAQLFVSYERMYPDRRYRECVLREWRAHAEAMGLS
jgi:hypothetical protein